ncbi:Pclo [Symbiodinium sp. CCMP2456]|nr:Pclo [Symbiodinium sp. CCMP2456]
MPLRTQAVHPEIFRSWAPVAESRPVGATLMGRVALLVGINEYSDEVGTLQYAVSDMKACQKALTNIGFWCMTCENQPRSKFLETLQNFLQLVCDDDDIVLFNFNGHCELVNEDGKDKPALIFDGRGLDDSGQQTGGHVMLEEVSMQLMKAKCSYDAEILLLMNCCRNYRKPETSLKTLSERSQVHAMGKNTHGRGLTSIWACSVGHWAADTSSFRQGLLSCIGQECDLWQLHKSISIHVRSHNMNTEGTRFPLWQRPCISANTDSDRNDFFLPDWSRASFGQKTYPGARLKHYAAQSHRETQTSPRMITLATPASSPPAISGPASSPQQNPAQSRETQTSPRRPIQQATQTSPQHSGPTPPTPVGRGDAVRQPAPELQEPETELVRHQEVVPEVVRPVGPPSQTTRDHVQAPLMFIFCASLHLTVWLLFWFTRCIQLRCTGWSIEDLARTGWSMQDLARCWLRCTGWSFNLMTISMFWASLSYSQRGQHADTRIGAVLSRHWPVVEDCAVGVWFPCFVSLAQGYADRVERDGQQKAVCYSLTTFLMTFMAKDIAKEMFREWRAVATPAVLARAFIMWRQVFLAACLQVCLDIYGWFAVRSSGAATTSSKAPRLWLRTPAAVAGATADVVAEVGEGAKRTVQVAGTAVWRIVYGLRDIHWFIVCGLVLTCVLDFRSTRRSKAFTLVLTGYSFSTILKVAAFMGTQYASLDVCISFCFAMALWRKVAQNFHLLQLPI